MNTLTRDRVAPGEGTANETADTQVPSFFSSDAWLTPWKEIYSRADDRLVSSPVVFPGPGGSEVQVDLPLVIRSERQAGLPLRVMRFMGTGDPDEDEVCTEFPDFRVSGSERGIAAKMIHGHLADHYRWDIYRFENVLPDSLVAAMMARLTAFRQAAGWRYSIGLDGSFSDWVDRLGRSTRSRVRRLMRVVENQGLELTWYDTPEALLYGLEVLARLHGSRWQSKGEEGVFVAPRFAEFHKTLVTRFPGSARVALLRRKGEVLSAWYGFDYAGVRYFYQSGFDPRHSDSSPGLVIHLLVIADAFERGLDFYDFMKGGEDSYKQHLSTRRTPVFHYVAPGTTRLGRLLPIVLKRRSGWHLVRE